jgi:hypothetical protein
LRVPPATLPGQEVLLSASVCNCCDHRGSGFPIRLASSALQWPVKPPTMASADFCPPIPPPHDSGSQWQVDRSPRVMRATFTLIPAASTSAVSVQVSGFEDNGLLTHGGRLLCDFCSSGQCFAFSFLQIPTRGGHPCCSANRSPCRAGRGLTPPSHPATTTVTGTAPVKALRAMPGAPQKTSYRMQLASLKPVDVEPQATRRPRLGKSSIASGTRGVERIILCRRAQPPSAVGGSREARLLILGRDRKTEPGVRVTKLKH